MPVVKKDFVICPGYSPIQHKVGVQNNHQAIHWAGGPFTRQSQGKPVQDTDVPGGQNRGHPGSPENSGYFNLERSFYCLLYRFVRFSGDQVGRFIPIQAAHYPDGQKILRHHDNSTTPPFIKKPPPQVWRIGQKMNPDLYNFHTLVLLPSTSNNSQTKALSLQLGLDHNPHSSQFCHSWNEGRCWWPFSRCQFCHVCDVCSGDHRSMSCPFRLVKATRCSRSPMPSGGKHQQRYTRHPTTCKVK